MDDLNVRDLFAMMAMNGLISSKGYGCSTKQYAEFSYEIANAMMNEKEKQDESAR
jgi:hypothetical protein